MKPTLVKKTGYPEGTLRRHGIFHRQISASTVWVTCVTYIMELSVDIKDLRASTLVGLTRENPVLNTLAVQQTHADANG